MTNQKAVLVATIGTRDLMFQVDSDTWYNIGNDRQNDDIISEQNQVTEALQIDWNEYKSFRNLTQYLLDNIEYYLTQIKPVILGKLLEDYQDKIESVYLVVTNQKEGIKEREKDTINAGYLIKHWLHHLNPEIKVEIITLGENNENPSDFEQMFQWWQKVWQNQIIVKKDQPLWVCLKGGVGQTAEASRISALSKYGEQVQFYEFTQNYKANLQGIGSDYSQPFLGVNYLWDRTQKQVLKLLDRYDYAGILDLLEPYFRQNNKDWSNIPNLIKAGLYWNQGEFNKFLNFGQSALDTSQKEQSKTYWWMAYEEAYLAVIRLSQNNTVEAVFHSFRSIEGLLSLWCLDTFSDITIENNKTPMISDSILKIYPQFKDEFEYKKQHQTKIRLTNWFALELLKLKYPEINNNHDLDIFWNITRNERNNIAHRIGGLSIQEVYQSWGNDIQNKTDWEKRILACLNSITGNRFVSLMQSSLFACIHYQLKQKLIINH